MVAAVISAATASGQTTTTFGAPTAPPVPGTCRNWGNESYGPTSGILTWYNAFLLNIPEYLNCWTNPPAQTGYPTGGKVAILESTPLQVQTADLSPFVLSSLSVGSGWTNGAILTLEGYLGTVAAPQLQYTKTLSGVDASEPRTSPWAIGGPAISWFRLSVNYNLTGAPSWSPTDVACLYATAPTAIAGCDVPDWAQDPYDSRLYQWQVDRANGMGGEARTTLPYQTIWIADVTTSGVPVPEPGTVSLVVVGLAGLVAARRRRTRR